MPLDHFVLCGARLSNFSTVSVGSGLALSRTVPGLTNGGGAGNGVGWGLEDDFSQEPALPTPQVQVGGLYKMQGLWSPRNPVTSVGRAGILMSSEQSFPHHAHFWGVIIEAGAFLPRLGLPCLTEACLLQGYSFQPSPPPPNWGPPPHASCLLSLGWNLVVCVCRPAGDRQESPAQPDLSASE